MLFLPVTRKPVPEGLLGFGRPGLGCAEEEETGLALAIIVDIREGPGAKLEAFRGIVREGPDRVVFLPALPAEGERHQHPAPITGDVLLARHGNVALVLRLE